MSKIDTEVLRAALVGYEHQRQMILEKIADLQKQIGGRTPKVAASTNGAAAEKPKRSMSASARKRIALAQKKRWARYHQTQTKHLAEDGKRQHPAVSAKPKRKMSAATRKKLAANLAKARAAKAAKAAA